MLAQVVEPGFGTALWWRPRKIVLHLEGMEEIGNLPKILVANRFDLKAHDGPETSGRRPPSRSNAAQFLTERWSKAPAKVDTVKGKGYQRLTVSRSRNLGDCPGTFNPRTVE